MSLTWFDCPSLEEVQSTRREWSATKGKILRLKRQIDKEDSKLKRQYPRKPHERAIELETLYDQLTELEVQEIDLDSEFKLLTMRLDMYRSNSYTQRKV